MRTRHVLGGAAAAGALAVGAVAAAAQAGAANTAPGAHSAAGGQRAAAGHSYLEFVKSADPQNSRLRYVYVPGSGPKRPQQRTVGSWRAGSGDGSKNTCLSNRGWLPNGTYKVKAFYKHHNGGRHGVNGVSWYVGDHRCHSGKRRTALFVHSEMLPSGKQGSSEPYRWDGAGDYKSNGCIKLKPSDIRNLRAAQARYPDPHTLRVR